MPGRIVRRSTYMKEYEELVHKDGIAFVPGVIWKDLFFTAAIYGMVALCAVVFGPFGPKGQPDPIIIQTALCARLFFPLDLLDPVVPAGLTRNTVHPDCARDRYRHPCSRFLLLRARVKSIGAGGQSLYSRC